MSTEDKNKPEEVGLPKCKHHIVTHSNFMELC